MSPFSSYWLRLHWSEWINPSDITTDSDGQSALKSSPGVYRIRVDDPPLIAYIGESKNLEQRIKGRWACLNETDRVQAMGKGDRFERLVDLAERFDWHYKISWATTSKNDTHDLSAKQERRSLEKALLWHYRRSKSRSSFANHGRAHSNAQVVGEGREVPSSLYPPNLTHVSSRSLPPSGHPSEKTWMGLRWTHFITEMGSTLLSGDKGFDTRAMAYGPALYKILDPQLDEVLQIGYSQHGEAGIRRRLTKLPGYPVGSWSPLRRAVYKHTCLELRDDLVGGYYSQFGSSPRYQFASEYDS